MTSNLKKQKDLAQDDHDSKGLVKMAIVKVAIAIQNEDTKTPNHAARSAYARQVLLDPDGYANRMIWGVASQAPDDPLDDAGIESIVSSIWNSYAFSYTPEVKAGEAADVVPVSGLSYGGGSDKPGSLVSKLRERMKV